MIQDFDRIAEDYDRWYDRPEGRAIFNAELQCLRSLRPCCRGPWLEAGVGAGRFAAGLHIETGIDPSLPMLGIAKKRGITVCAARAEDLPFPNKTFDGVLLALALCFIGNPGKALRECARVLRPKGRLLVGIIPADGPWGGAYIEKKEKGDSIYASAHFFQTPEIVSLIGSSELKLDKAASALFWKPGEPPEGGPRIEEGLSPDAGFLALLCMKT